MKADIGLIGLAVMGENLVMNMTAEPRARTLSVHIRLKNWWTTWKSHVKLCLW